MKLRVLYAGVCGIDVHGLYVGPLFTPGDVPCPVSGVVDAVVLGPVLPGEVVEAGSGVTGVSVGALVAVCRLQTCGTCDFCRFGAYNLCPTRAGHGLCGAGGASRSSRP